MNNSPNINLMLTALRKAHKKLIRDFGELQNLQNSPKFTEDFTNKTYESVKNYLIEELQKVKPDYSIIIKNGERIEGKNNNFCWIVNPISGTKELSRAHTSFAISLSLEKKISNNYKEVIATIIDLPALQETYFAEKGCGAWVIRSSSIQVGTKNRIRVSQRKSFDNSIIVANLKTVNFSDKYICKILKKFNYSILNQPIAFLLTSLASGRVDCIITDNIDLYESLGGALLIKEAGGMFNTYTDNSNICINFVASNANLNQDILKLIDINL